MELNWLYLQLHWDRDMFVTDAASGVAAHLLLLHDLSTLFLLHRGSHLLCPVRILGLTVVQAYVCGVSIVIGTQRTLLSVEKQHCLWFVSCCLIWQVRFLARNLLHLCAVLQFWALEP